MLRWIVDRGLIAIPKAETEKELRENIEIDDFEISVPDADKIAHINRYRKKYWDPDHVN